MSFLRLLVYLFLQLSVFSSNPNLESVKTAMSAMDEVSTVGEVPFEDCFKNQQDIDRSVEEGTIVDANGDDIKISIVSKEYANELFDLMASQSHIPFGYPEDGCYARAHEMSILLKEQGITSTKTFIEGDLRVETENSPKGYVNWWYHVAPIIAVKTGKKIKEKYTIPGSRIKRTRYIDEYEVVVIDPSIFSKPVSIHEWRTIQTSHSDADKNTYQTRRYNYFPSSKFEEMYEYKRGDIMHMNITMATYLRVQKHRQSKTN